MHYNETSVTVRDLMYTIIPRLNSAQRLVNNTLDSLIEVSKQPEDLARRLDQQRRFQMETHAIHMNLEHLLKRYQEEINAVTRSEGRLPGAQISPDEMEADAISRAQEIYARVHAFQTGSRKMPF
ncbi:hypothetical protein VRRI112168_15645 [Vreelandella rituensis]|uniref:Uncharacterized protein n=1 Tax=Vreelandella rituensis TaxID=2282306 RepID=A0A368TQA2_9GAMM|nr:hypothetical protein [Halomonas rituensis]RCV86781.1 hypothetical protein DU506_17815 [Halomonas rituensis]